MVCGSSRPPSNGIELRIDQQAAEKLDAERKRITDQEAAKAKATLVPHVGSIRPSMKRYARPLMKEVQKGCKLATREE
jgi:hypothetical protein